MDRVCQEQANKEKGPDAANVRIGKCMNVLRMVIEKQEYVLQFAQVLEEKLTPLYMFMADPRAISFDEDILMIIKSFIKRTQQVTPVQWEIFQKFPLVFEKQKH